MNGMVVSDGSNLSYSYFLLTDGQMYTDHSVEPQWNNGPIPSCTSTAGRDFINSFLISKYSPNAVATNVNDAVNAAMQFVEQKQTTFYILLDMNYISDYENTFNQFYYEYGNRLAGYGYAAGANFSGNVESNYLVITVTQDYYY